MIKLTKIERTDDSNPSVWRAKADDNRQVYIIYNHGYLSVTSETSNDFGFILVNEEFGINIGDSSCGTLSNEELKAQTSHFLEFPDGEIEKEYED